MNITLIFENLSKEQANAYAFINAQRLYVEYQHFQRLRNWGNSKLLIRMLEKALDGFSSDDEIEKAIVDVEIMSPDSNDFPEVDSTFALDACCAAYDYLHYLKTGELSYIESIYNLCLNSTDIFIRDNYSTGIYSNNDSDSYKNTYAIFEEKEKAFHRDVIKCISIQNDLSSRQVVENVYRIIPKAESGIISFLSSSSFD